MKPPKKLTEEDLIFAANQTFGQGIHPSLVPEMRSLLNEIHNTRLLNNSFHSDIYYKLSILYTKLI